MYDPYTDIDDMIPDEVGVYFIGTKHPDFLDFPYPQGSTVLDPWRYIPDIEGVNVIRIGEGDGKK